MVLYIYIYIYKFYEVNEVKEYSDKEHFDGKFCFMFTL